jgi:hypothetical protein
MQFYEVITTIYSILCGGLIVWVLSLNKRISEIKSDLDMAHHMLFTNDKEKRELIYAECERLYKKHKRSKKNGEQ